MFFSWVEPSSNKVVGRNKNSHGEAGKSLMEADRISQGLAPGVFFFASFGRS